MACFSIMGEIYGTLYYYRENLWYFLQLWGILVIAICTIYLLFFVFL